MLCLALLVVALTGRCRGDSDNSSSSVPASRRMAAAQVHSLRRQLMRDNYDYQHSGDETPPNITARSSDDTKFYNQKGGTDHLPRASELAQANSNAFNAESGQQEHFRQSGQFEQRGQLEQGRQYDQSSEYEHRGKHELRGQHEQGRHHKQRGEYENRGQYGQPGEHEQRGQYDQRDQYEQHEQNEQREHSEQQEQLGQFDEQEQAPSIEQKPRIAPIAPPVAVPFTDELTVRDVFEREHTQERHDSEPDQANKYNPSYYNKQHDAYDPTYPAQMERKPFSDLRGNYKEQYGQNKAGNGMGAQEKLTRNAQQSPDQEYAADQEAFDQQDASGSQDDEESDFSVSQKQPKRHNEFVKRSTSHANRVQYRAQSNAPSHRIHNSLSYRNLPLHQNRNAPPLHGNAQPPHRIAPPPHRNAPDHNISKKDLLYYMDDSQLRRRNNDASPDVPDEDQPADDQLPSPQPSPSHNNSAGTRTNPGKHTRRPASTEGRSGGELPRTSRTRHSFVVTVSAGNVTYKLLTLKSRSGRRQDERRILEERGPAGVAIMSLDHAPLPAFRLPRARRQYMHTPHHYRHQKPA